MKKLKIKILRRIIKLNQKKFSLSSLGLAIFFGGSILGALICAPFMFIYPDPNNLPDVVLQVMWGILSVSIGGFILLALFVEIENEIDLKNKYGSLRNRNKHRNDNSDSGSGYGPFPGEW